MAEIKIDGNTFEASDQDQTTSVSCVTYNERGVVKSRWSILDLTIQRLVFHESRWSKN